MSATDAVPVKTRKLITDAITQTLAAAHRAETSAQWLRTLILTHRHSLVPGSTMLSETATLLSHAAQNFQRLVQDDLSHAPDARPRRTAPKALSRVPPRPDIAAAGGSYRRISRTSPAREGGAAT
jgi:hypothetical protein